MLVARVPSPYLLHHVADKRVEVGKCGSRFPCKVIHDQHKLVIRVRGGDLTLSVILQFFFEAPQLCLQLLCLLLELS